MLAQASNPSPSWLALSPASETRDSRELSPVQDAIIWIVQRSYFMSMGSKAIASRYTCWQNFITVHRFYGSYVDGAIYIMRHCQGTNLLIVGNRFQLECQASSGRKCSASFLGVQNMICGLGGPIVPLPHIYPTWPTNTDLNRKVREKLEVGKTLLLATRFASHNKSNTTPTSCTARQNSFTELLADPGCPGSSVRLISLIERCPYASENGSYTIK